MNQPTAAAFIDQPLVLISQIQRSGGSMLAQLFDGHPEIFAHPAELFIGYPNKWDWPRLDLGVRPLNWFGALFEHELLKFVKKGFSKGKSNEHARRQKMPYDFSPERQRELFLEVCAARPARSQRDILDAYFTSYFGAWADWRATGRERYVTAFCPRVVMHAGSVARFLADYPDGRIVSSVRDPRTWYVSSRAHSPETYPDPARAIDQWRRSTEAVLALAAAKPESHFFVAYEALIADPPRVMARLAAWLGIEYLDILTVPTYLGQPVPPNSSFQVAETGVNKLSLERVSWLDPAERDYIEREAMPLYESAVAASRS